jgi:hypothetical protein
MSDLIHVKNVTKTNVFHVGGKIKPGEEADIDQKDFEILSSQGMVVETDDVVEESEPEKVETGDPIPMKKSKTQ